MKPLCERELSSSHRPNLKTALRTHGSAAHAAGWLLPAALLLAGCGNEAKPGSAGGTNAASSGGSPLTAPVDYLNAAAKGQQSAVRTLDTTSLDKAIQLFGVDHGRNPTDLNELVKGKYIPKIPDPPYGTKIVYDASAGTVSIQKQ
jgi:hypothetical protein